VTIIRAGKVKQASLKETTENLKKNQAKIWASIKYLQYGEEIPSFDENPCLIFWRWHPRKSI
jgi:hypothetical protein